MKRILVLMGLCVLLSNTSCQSKEEKKEEATEYAVTNPLKKDTAITNSVIVRT